MKSAKGAITLEACVSVLSFLILMLLLSSLFLMYMAQNATAHAVLETSESLSLDAYSSSKNTIEEGHIGSVEQYISEFVSHFWGRPSKSTSFADSTRWYESKTIKVPDVVKRRFIGYLAGGDEEKADKELKRMNVVNGLTGLDFSESYVSNDVLYVVLNYELEYDFNIWNMGKVSVHQKACSKLWK